MALAAAKRSLETKVTSALRSLHWKDFELLVDLVFRQSGWRRISVVGETMKSIDLELEDPITGDRYQVQVKSRASKEVIERQRATCAACAHDFRKYYLVVHTPEGNVGDQLASTDEPFEVILPDRLAQMVVDLGLTGWLLEKVR